MKKHRFRRFVKWLILIAIIIIGVLWFKGYWSKQPETMQITKPSEGPNFSSMSVDERQQVIEQAQQDAELAAKASGQSGEHSENVGKQAATEAQNAIDRSLIIDGMKK